ncbi:MAG: hypothetical protein JO290_10160 [Sphingomonadaceae bacterium]|nr:hypothetical protein [Sphingomonadaceae bacterium]
MRIAFAVAAALLATAATAQKSSTDTSPMASHDAMPTHDAMASHDAMSPNAMTKIPAADMKRISQCKAMTPDAMAKSAMCQKMMKLYPAAFSGSVSTN